MDGIFKESVEARRCQLPQLARGMAVHAEAAPRAGAPLRQLAARLGKALVAPGRQPSLARGDGRVPSAPL